VLAHSEAEVKGVPLSVPSERLKEARTRTAAQSRVVRPPHYTSHPSGIECIEVTRHMTFNRGNAIKYLWRAGDKNDVSEDLEKAIWYCLDELTLFGGLDRAEILLERLLSRLNSLKPQDKQATTKGTNDQETKS